MHRLCSASSPVSQVAPCPAFRSAASPPQPSAVYQTFFPFSSVTVRNATPGGDPCGIPLMCASLVSGQGPRVLLLSSLSQLLPELPDVSTSL